jgi:hypothetical protein
MPQSQLPVLIVIDVEPNEIYVEPNRGLAWTGFERALEVFGRFREENGAHFTWVYRMDPQIELGYGSASWPATHYARETAALVAAGDDIGLHPHGFRWSETEQRWTVPLDDQDWLDECLRLAADAFDRTLGRRCTTFRYGDRWMSRRTLALLEELGARYDLTLEPGHPVVPISRFRRGTGDLPDFVDVPSTPFHPSRKDGLLCIPMTTAGVRPRLIRAAYDFVRNRFSATKRWTALVSHEPVLFRRILSDALSRNPSHLGLPVRSGVFASRRLTQRVATNLAWLLRHPMRETFRWSTSHAIAPGADDREPRMPARLR